MEICISIVHMLPCGVADCSVITMLVCSVIVIVIVGVVPVGVRVVPVGVGVVPVGVVPVGVRVVPVGVVPVGVGVLVPGWWSLWGSLINSFGERRNGGRLSSFPWWCCASCATIEHVGWSFEDLLKSRNWCCFVRWWGCGRMLISAGSSI